MILSPYINPSYRTPTPKSMASPAPGPSPKRKRIHSDRASTPLRVDTNGRHDCALDTGADSPRTKVAATFQDLSLQPLHSPEVVIRGHQHIGTPRKRLRQCQPSPQAGSGFESSSDPVEEVYSSPQSSSQPAAHSRSASPLEIGETPDCKVRVPSSPPFSPGRSTSVRSSWATWTDTGSEEGRPKEPPPAHASTPQVSSSQVRDDATDRAMSPTVQIEDLDLDQVALTWQDSEITGQDIDLTSPDDDGLGINGIGFKPTPAMAYVRSQKRKQQVNEWRAREAREARQKRIERRRGASTGGPRRKSTTKRSVRFEDVG